MSEGGGIHTSVGGRFALPPFASSSSSSRLAALLDTSGRSSNCLTRTLAGWDAGRGGSLSSGGFAGGGRIGIGLSHLAQLLQVLLDCAGGADGGVGGELMRC